MRGFIFVLILYEIFIQDWDSNKNLILSTVLDPHYKLFYLDEFQYDRFRDYLLMEVEIIALKSISEDTQTEIPKVEAIEMHSDDPFEEFLRERSILSPSSQPSPSIADAKAQTAGQVAEYLNTPRFEGCSSDFWKDPLNAAKFPLLLPLVRKYHSAPMSSSECEHVFSVAKYILDDRRKSLTMENLEK
uniref:HAT C-terminal dimerisation domain-containing protein n=1 Tax=Meloidogyne enterolobii TaxID=390850 RepID=A0A6V7XS26_MELEN|nr:unnamed protein product [Meloidogyne enterolobii]